MYTQDLNRSHKLQITQKYNNTHTLTKKTSKHNQNNKLPTNNNRIRHTQCTDKPQHEQTTHPPTPHYQKTHPPTNNDHKYLPNLPSTLLPKPNLKHQTRNKKTHHYNTQHKQTTFYCTSQISPQLKTRQITTYHLQHQHTLHLQQPQLLQPSNNIRTTTITHQKITRTYNNHPEHIPLPNTKTPHTILHRTPFCTNKRTDQQINQPITTTNLKIKKF